MSRQELVNQLKRKNPNLSKIEIEIVIDTFSECIIESLKQGRNVELRGFGTFCIKKIKENYSARNPKTGELIYVPEKNKVRFRPSKKLKDFVNK